jgi:thiol:disulfide interchange protein DsbD
MKKRGMVPILLFLLILLFHPALDLRAGSTPAPAATPLKSAQLVVIEAGGPGPVKLGLHVELEAGWHLYWINPGDAGLAPKARWSLPKGAAAGPLRHPVPKKTLREGIISLEHENPVLFLCEIAPPASGWPSGPWKAAAVLEWMACRETCVTGETAVEAAVPGSSSLFAQVDALTKGTVVYKPFAARFPRPLSSARLAASPARAEWTGSAWRIEIALSGPRAAEATDFFAYPVEDFVIDNAGVTCRDGKIVCPLIPSRGPGSPPPPVLAGVLVVDGAGYEISVPIAVMKQAARPSIGPAPFYGFLGELEAYPEPSRREGPPGLVLIASWR